MAVHFSVNLEADYNVKVELGAAEKEDLLGVLSKSVDTFNKMGKWLENPKVSPSQKDQYMPAFRNLLRSINFIWHLLEVSGVDQTEIREHVELPF